MIKLAVMPIVVVCSFLLLSACTLPSGENVFDDERQEQGQDREEVDLNESDDSISLETAINRTQSDLLERFWFRAHIANNIEKRRNTHMTLNGIVERPHGYYMHNSLLTERYEYYRWDDQTYIRQNSNWFRGREPQLPFDIFYGFDEWGDYVDDAEVIGEDDVLGIPTHVHEMELSGTELLEIDSPTLNELIDVDSENLSSILEDTTLRVLFYVGDVAKSTDNQLVLPIIYKYQTWIQMPIPGAGYMEQEVQYFIFRVNDEQAELIDVDEIEKYLIEIDDTIDELEEELEEEID